MIINSKLPNIYGFEYKLKGLSGIIYTLANIYDNILIISESW